MSRQITDHLVAGDLPQNQIVVEVEDQPGSGGACHAYLISGFSAGLNPSIPYRYDGTLILFQNGPIKEAGLNGVTHEALLAILIDRLRGFAKGPFPSRETSIALTKLEEALFWLQSRTRDRLARGVEGVLKA
jgi:hypothetical protein